MERDRRTLLAILGTHKSAALRLKQTVNWKSVERDWDEYFAQFSGEQWREEFMPEIEGVIIDQGERLNVQFGIQFDVVNLFSLDWFDQYLLVFAQDILGTTKTDISQMLQQAMNNGWSIDEMSKQLNATFDRYLDPEFRIEDRRLTDEERQWFIDRQPRFRRDAIARTETLRASNAGATELYRAWGAEFKEWLATADSRTRATHLRAWANYSEGGTPGPMPMDDAFLVGGDRLQYPGDPAGSAGEVINCRCTTIVFFEEFPSSQSEIDQAQGFVRDELARQEAESLA